MDGELRERSRRSRRWCRVDEEERKIRFEVYKIKGACLKILFGFSLKTRRR